MTCIKCKKPAVTNFKHLGKLCRGCFLHKTEARVRRDLRTQPQLTKGDTLYLVNEESAGFKVMNHIMESILKDFPHETKIIKLEEIKEENKTALPYCADDLGAMFLQHMIEKTKLPNTLLPLRSLSEEEVTTFANLKEFEYKKKDKNIYNDIMNKIQKQYPGTEFSMLKSVELIKKLS